MLPALLPRSAGRLAPRFVDAFSRGLATEGGKEASTARVRQTQHAGATGLRLATTAESQTSI